MTVIHRFVTTYARSNYLTILNYVLKFKKYDKNHGHFTAKIHSTWSNSLKSQKKPVKIMVFNDHVILLLIW